MEKRNSELTGFVVSSFRLRHIHSYTVPIHHAPWGFSCIHNCCWLKYCTNWNPKKQTCTTKGRLYWHVYTKQILSISTWCMVVSWPATPLAMFPVSHWHETNERERERERGAWLYHHPCPSRRYTVDCQTVERWEVDLDLHQCSRISVVFFCLVGEKKCHVFFQENSTHSLFFTRIESIISHIPSMGLVW